MRNRRAFFLVAIVILAATPILPAQPDVGDVAKFSDSIGASKSVLFSSGQKFGARIKAAMDDGKADNYVAMKAAYVDALIAIAKMEEEWKTAKPPGGKSGMNLHAAFRAFLQQQRKSAHSAGLEMVRIVEDPNLTADEKNKKLDHVVEVNHKAEQEAEAALEKAHKAFRDEHQIK